MVTWTTGGRTYEVTDEQRDALDALRSEYTELFGKELNRASETELSQSGRYLCNASKPLKPLTDEYLGKIRAILGPNPKVVAAGGKRA